MKSSRILWAIVLNASCVLMLLVGACSAPVEIDGQITTEVSNPELDLDKTIVLCETNADCADFERGACEMVICQEEGYCIPLPVGNGTLCDDGNSCTSDEMCEGGICGGGVNDCPCEVDTDCADKSEGDLCEGGLVCINGGCEPDPAGPVLCEDIQGDCVITGCDPATGACVDQVSPDGSACATDNACLTGAICLEGACEGGSALECPGGGPCVTVTCDSAVGCVDTPTNDGEVCNDGNPCSTDDVCELGLCVGQEGSCECESDDDCLPYVSDLCVMGMTCEEGACVAYDVVVECPEISEAGCSQTVCDPGTGICGLVDAPDGAQCETGSACDESAACVEGACVPAEDGCDDDNPCTNDECDEVKGCTNTPLDAGPCDDGNPCSADDSCAEGACLPGQDICACETNADCAGEEFDQCLGQWSCGSGACVVKPNTAVNCDDTEVSACQIATCEPSTGQCVVGDAADGATCDDGNGCTSDDTCAQGACAGSVDDCDDENPCTDDSCKPASGCKHTDNSKPCDDGNACTSGDFCTFGSCFGGAAVLCPSSIACTQGVCDSLQGCVAETVADGTDCDDGTDCTGGDSCTGGVCSGDSVCECLSDADCKTSENGDLCDGQLACVDGACEVDPDTIVVCSSGGPCEEGTCDPVKGTCSLVASNEGEPCEPGPCLLQGTCEAGTCSGEPVDCDDGSPCTNDNCDLNTGLCANIDQSGPCDDSDPCTLNESCKDGLCSGGFLFPCNDSNSCTKDTCEPGVGCAFKPVDCDDGDACTFDTCGDEGSCVHEVKVCASDIATPCQSGYCEAATGACVEGQSPDGEACNDDDLCTSGDTCQSGSCIAGDLDDCDDGDACTIDLCAPDSGCQNTEIPCESDDPCISASCQGGGCMFTVIDSPNCNGDGVACTGSNGSSCNDQNGETSSDICVQGICRGFTKQNLYAEGPEGNVRATGVSYAYGQWFMIVQIFGGSLGTVNELLVYGSDDDPNKLVVYDETAISPKWTDMHEGFAIHEGGELWRYNPTTESWSGEDDLGDLFIENNLIKPKSIWVHKTSQKDLRLWAVGEPNGQAFPVLTCSEKKLADGGANVSCSGQALDTDYSELLLKAVAGTAQCQGGGACEYHLLLGADYPGDDGDYTDIFENGSGLEDSWDYTFNDSEAQDGHTTYDVAALGDETYMIVGGAGYVRHRAPDGDLTWLPELKSSQTQRDFRGVWSGAGTVVIAATRDLNSGPDAEIWTASTSSDLIGGGSWTVLKLGDLAEGSVIHDVWGDDTGSICVVGEEVIGGGATAAVIFRR